MRNPGLGKTEIETAMKSYLGVKNIFWLAKGPKGDDTHGHVDDICRFVNAKTLVLVQEKNPRDENFPSARGKLGPHRRPASRRRQQTGSDSVADARAALF